MALSDAVAMSVPFVSLTEDGDGMCLGRRARRYVNGGLVFTHCLHGSSVVMAASCNTRRGRPSREAGGSDEECMGRTRLLAAASAGSSRAPTTECCRGGMAVRCWVSESVVRGYGDGACNGLDRQGGGAWERGGGVAAKGEEGLLRGGGVAAVEAISGSCLFPDVSPDRG